MPAAAFEAVRLVHHQDVGPGRRRPLRQGGVRDQILEGHDRARVGLEGIERAGPARGPRRRGARRRAGRRPGGTSATARESHCTVRVEGATTRARSARPLRSRRASTRQASTVLPRPTSSARSQRTGSLAAARSATWSWCGKELDASAQERAEAPACRSSSSTRASRRLTKCPGRSTSSAASRSRTPGARSAGQRRPLPPRGRRRAGSGRRRQALAKHHGLVVRVEPGRGRRARARRPEARRRPR